MIGGLVNVFYGKFVGNKYRQESRRSRHFKKQTKRAATFSGERKVFSCRDELTQVSLLKT